MQKIKNLNYKSPKNIKFLFISMGPGETGHAIALARYIFKKGGRILFALQQEKNLNFLSEDKNFDVFLTSTPKELKKIVEKEKPMVLLIFNSKIWGSHFKDFLKEPPFKKPPLTVCVDSNWLFNDKKYPNFRFIKWADKYLIVFPKKIFDLGLKKNKGTYIISKPFLKKIFPIGFIPSYQKPIKKEVLEVRKKYKIKSDEKFIFSYFSGLGAGHRTWAFENLIRAVDKLIKRGEKIKVLYVGPTEDLNQRKLKRKWLIKIRGLPASEYFSTLASADLVFQHQGLVTLVQAISAQVPVIANVSILKSKIPKNHFWEVKPFVRVGTCIMLSKSIPTKKISQSISQLLFNKKAIEKMKEKQKSIFERGEKKSFEIVIQEIRNSDLIPVKK